MTPKSRSLTPRALGGRAHLAASRRGTTRGRAASVCLRMNSRSGSLPRSAAVAERGQRLAGGDVGAGGRPEGGLHRLVHALRRSAPSRRSSAPAPGPSAPASAAPTACRSRCAGSTAPPRCARTTSPSAARTAAATAPPSPGSTPAGATPARRRSTRGRRAPRGRRPRGPARGRCDGEPAASSSRSGARFMPPSPAARRTRLRALSFRPSTRASTSVKRAPALSCGLGSLSASSSASSAIGPSPTPTRKQRPAVSITNTDRRGSSGQRATTRIAPDALPTPRPASSRSVPHATRQTTPSDAKRERQRLPANPRNLRRTIAHRRRYTPGRSSVSSRSFNPFEVNPRPAHSRAGSGRRRSTR